MDREHYEEMCGGFERLTYAGYMKNKRIYLFGHCNAAETLADLFLQKGLVVKGILDNNVSKHGRAYRDIVIMPPENVRNEPAGQTVVCIAARASEAMSEQLRDMGFAGEIVKLAEYDSYAEYSLTAETIGRKRMRVERGMAVRRELEEKYKGYFKIFCPFSALGDIFFTMSYLNAFRQKNSIGKCVICVIGDACKEVVSLFGPYRVQSFTQRNLDELIQACLYGRDRNFFIAHQDRPYVVNLHRALYVKCIPLEIIYRCGVFGLPIGTEPEKPEHFRQYPYLNRIRRGKAVILSPYAKSVSALPRKLWEEIVRDYKGRGYQCLTNVAGEEKPLEGTEELRAGIAELQSAAEWAGHFIGIRSGLCDVLTYAKCEKTVLYPDYNYSDTSWKAAGMYPMREGWKNIAVGKDFKWNRV